MSSSTHRLVSYAKALAVVITAVSAAAVASWITGITPWIAVSKEATAPQAWNERIGTLVAPLRELDFESGDWAAYILVTLDDYRESGKVLPSTCLKPAWRAEVTAAEPLHREIEEAMRSDGDEGGRPAGE